MPCLKLWKKKIDNEKTQQQRFEIPVEELQNETKQYIGRLTNEQKRLIETCTKRFESNFSNGINYRRNIQQTARTLLITHRLQLTF